MNQTAPNLQAKNHYQVLDGLRGVAAMLVVVFHLFETYTGGNHRKQILNHGYLAVDFFFMFSGFVVAYAYDDRWSRMRQWDFYKRRLIRLQPMVVMGSIIGAALFYLASGPTFPLIEPTPVWKVLLLMVVGFTLIPVTPSMDIRGWQEMHPLDGPAWSLFFEYIANILYAVGLRRLSNRSLGVLVLLAAAFLVHLGVTAPKGDVIGGWSVTPAELHVGFARMLYPFLAGMLLMRSGWRLPMGNALAISGLLLVLVLCLPRVGGADRLWLNGLYDTSVILLVFPVILAIGAGEREQGELTHRVARLFGDLSYPLYITHYPLIYIYTAWVIDHRIRPAQGAVWGAVLFGTAVLIAFACLKWYDEPVRRWLARRYLTGRT